MILGLMYALAGTSPTAVLGVLGALLLGITIPHVVHTFE